MHPVNADGSEWNVGHARVALREIAATVEAELTARDETNGILPGSGYKVYGPGDRGRFAVDLRRAEIRSCGAEVKYGTRERWMKFCAQPQNEAEYMRTRGASVTRAAEIRSQQKHNAERASELTGVPAKPAPQHPSQQSQPPKNVRV